VFQSASDMNTVESTDHNISLSVRLEFYSYLDLRFDYVSYKINI